MKIEAWMVLKAKPSYGVYPAGSPWAGQKKIGGARVVRTTVSKPTLDTDEIAFKIELDVDESWFLEGTATIQASVPAQPAQSAVIPATVDMPIKGRGKSAAASVVQRP